MNNPLYNLLSQSFSYPRVKMFMECDDLLQAYGVTEHIDEIRDLLNTPVAEDIIQLPFEIEIAFKKEMHRALLSLYIVPAGGDLSMYHQILSAVYTLENSFESAMIIEIIEDADEVASTREVLSSLFEQVCEMDWAFVQENILEVRGSLIELLKIHHVNKLIDNPNDEDPIMSPPRLECTIAYFTEHPDTVTRSLISSGLLAMPSEEAMVLSALTPVLYKLQDPEAIAKELMAMSVILPITMQSVPIQAKKFNNKVFLDARLIMAVNLQIDMLTRTLTKE